MAETFMLAGKVAFAAVGCAAGVRLWQMARREHGLPLHAWVSGMIFVGGIGLVLFAVGPSLAAGSRGLARAAMLVGDGLERVALLALAVFVWRLFGAGTPWRLALAAAFWAVVIGDWIQLLSLDRWPEEPVSGARDAICQLVFAAPFLWSASETFAQWRRSRRQLRLGLGDPVVSDRYRLWSAGCAGFACICLLGALASFQPAGSSAADAIRFAQGALYAAIAALVLVGLFPPAFYLRRLRRA